MINSEQALSIYLKSQKVEEVVDEILKNSFEHVILESAKTQRFAQVSLKHEGFLQYYNVYDFNLICKKLKNNLKGLGYDVHLRSLNVINTDVVFDIIF